MAVETNKSERNKGRKEGSWGVKAREGDLGDIGWISAESEGACAHCVRADRPGS